MATSSAFQPYRRPPDPFVSAPFDHIPEKSGKISSSSSSSVTPTKSLANQSRKTSKSKVKLQNEINLEHTPDKLEDLTDTNLSTPIAPVSNKKSSSLNPFINAPFTAKKSRAITVIQSQVPVSASLSSINATSELTHFTSNPNIKKIVYPQTDKKTSALIRQLSSENSDHNKQSVSKIPQSHSLNEIKLQPSRLMNDASGIASGTTSKLINQFSQQNLSQENEIKAVRIKSSQEQIGTQVYKQKIEILDSRIRSEESKKPANVRGSDSSSNSRRDSQTTIHKSNSANLSSITNQTENTNNNNSTTKSLNPGNAGGISNMSFDDY